MVPGSKSPGKPGTSFGDVLPGAPRRNQPVSQLDLYCRSPEGATTMLYDLRHAFRALLRRPGLSLAVLLILALGIGATTTIFSIASSVLLGTIPYKDGDRLVALETLGERDGAVFPVSYWSSSRTRRARRST